MKGRSSRNASGHALRTCRRRDRPPHDGADRETDSQCGYDRGDSARCTTAVVTPGSRPRSFGRRSSDRPAVETAKKRNGSQRGAPWRISDKMRALGSQFPPVADGHLGGQARRPQNGGHSGSSRLYHGQQRPLVRVEPGKVAAPKPCRGIFGLDGVRPLVGDQRLS